MKKRTKVRLITFALSGFALLGGFWLDTHLTLQASSTQLEYVYRRALGDLTDSVSAMQFTLQKAQYAGTPATQTAVSSELLEQAGEAKSAIASLPFSPEKSGRFNRFLSQAGDYGLSLSRRSLAGERLTSEDLENLRTLRDYAGKLTEALTGLQARLTVEGDGIVQNVHLLNNIDEIDSLSVLDDDFDAVAEEFAAFPALLYDGPFSDHISGRKPAAIEGEEGVSQERARELAAEFLSCSPEELSLAGEGGGSLPVYSFTAGDSMVNITRQGGRPAYYKKAGGISAARLSEAQALAAAEEYLAKLGFGPVEESYSLLNDNLATFNFHCLAETSGGEDVLCYPDLIKVVIELEQGGTVEFDAAGYLMNHRTRMLLPPKISESEAQSVLSPMLKAQNTRLAVIPTPGLDEVLCWELRCTAADGQEVLSYVNAETGMEERLFVLQKDGHGALAG